MWNQKQNGDFPGSPGAGSLPANAGDTGLLPGPGRFRTAQGNYAESHNYELGLWNPKAAATEARTPYSPWSTTREVTTRKRPRTAEERAASTRCN